MPTPSPYHNRPVKTLDELRAAAQKACIVAHQLRQEAIDLSEQFQATRFAARSWRVFGRQE